MLGLSSSQFDPGCVKTCTSQECAELFSLSSSLSSGRKHFWFSNLRNRDGISTRRLNVGVFTQPRPKTDIEPAECERVIHGQSLLNEEKLELAAIAARALRHTLVFGQGVKRQAQRAINPIGTEPLPPSEQ